MTEPIDPDRGWSMPVHDTLGREREIVVRDRGLSVIVTVPLPGAQLTGPETTLYIAALTKARNRVFEREFRRGPS